MPCCRVCHSSSHRGPTPFSGGHQGPVPQPSSASLDVQLAPPQQASHQLGLLADLLVAVVVLADLLVAVVLTDLLVAVVLADLLVAVVLADLLVAVVLADLLHGGGSVAG